MQREDAQRLLRTVRELAKKDLVVETYLALAEVEVKAELQDGFKGISEQYIDDAIIANHLLKLVNDVIVMQTNRCNNYMQELFDIYRHSTGVQ